ncbi:MAG: YigZ family protein [Spirochaetales bacterium]|nr:YigZ family protein [Spirochaetales bacterium]
MKKVMVPSEKGTSEFTIKKSRFISHLYKVADDGEVKQLLKTLRAEHPQSRHVVWAYVLGDAGTLYGLSDDGEPHGTAGRPVLEVLKGSGMTYAAVFVIRYFGGIKLGTGGLVQAYTQAAQEAVAEVEAVEKIDYTSVLLECSYSQYERIKGLLQGHEAREISEDFAENVTISAEIPDRNIEACGSDIFDFSQGSVEIMTADE